MNASVIKEAQVRNEGMQARRHVTALKQQQRQAWVAAFLVIQNELNGHGILRPSSSLGLCMYTGEDHYECIGCVQRTCVRASNGTVTTLMLHPDCLPLSTSALLGASTSHLA